MSKIFEKLDKKLSDKKSNEKKEADKLNILWKKIYKFEDEVSTSVLTSHERQKLV